MFSLSHLTSALLFTSAMLVSVMSACLLKVALVVGAHGAILLAFLDWVILTVTLVVIVQWNFVGKYCGSVLLSWVYR